MSRIRHSGADPGVKPGEEPGIHNLDSRLWIPGSRRTFGPRAPE